MVASTLITNASFLIALANALQPQADRLLAARASTHEPDIKPEK